MSETPGIPTAIDPARLVGARRRASSATLSPGRSASAIPAEINVSAFAIASECQIFVTAMSKVAECAGNIADSRAQLEKKILELGEGSGGSSQDGASDGGSSGSSSPSSLKQDLVRKVQESTTLLDEMFKIGQEIIADPTNAARQEQLRITSRNVVDALRSMVTISKNQSEEEELLETAEMVQTAVTKLISALNGPQEEVVQGVRLVTSACRRLFSPGRATMFDIMHEGLKNEYASKVEQVQKAAVKLLKIVREAQLRPNDPEVQNSISNIVGELVVDPVREFVELAKQVANRRLAEKQMKFAMKALGEAADNIPELVGEEIREEMYQLLKDLALSCCDVVDSTLAKTYQLLITSARRCTESMSGLVGSINKFAEDISDQSVFEELVRAAKSLKYSVVRLIAATKSLRTNDRDFQQAVQLAESAKSIAVAVKDVVSFLELHRSNQDVRGLGLNSDDVNVWDEPPADSKSLRLLEGTTMDNPTIVGGTLNQLVIYLTSRNADLQYGKAFIATYRSFTTPEAFFSKLMQRFHNPSLANEKERKLETVSLRVCNVLNAWLESYFHDFNDELLQRVDDFVTELESLSLHLPAKKLRKTIGVKLQLDQVAKTLLVEEAMKRMSQAVDIFSYDPEVIARHLSILDFRIYKGIKPHELLQGCWKKKELHHLSPNVMAMIHRFNMISYWVANVVITTAQLKARGKIMTSIIRVAESLRKVNNFHTLQALLSGLNNSSVYRLKFTLAEIPKSVQSTFHKLEELMSSSGSFSNFRCQLHSVNPPAIPYIGVYLTDLTFIEDGNPDALDGLINFEKRTQLYGVISEIQQYQLAGYDFGVDNRLLESLENLPTLEDSELYRLSLELEPRNATKSQVK